MGLSLKYFIYDEDTDLIISIPSSKFEKLFNRDPSFSLKEYCGREIKYIEVFVRLENRKPDSIIGMKFHIMKIDRDGKLDLEFENEYHQAAAQLIPVPMSGAPDNVIDGSSDFAGKKFRSKYCWKPPPDMENRVKSLIFKNEYRWRL